jgi:hypothetical protein
MEKSKKKTVILCVSWMLYAPSRSNRNRRREGGGEEEEEEEEEEGEEVN